MSADLIFGQPSEPDVTASPLMLLGFARCAVRDGRRRPMTGGGR